MAKWKVYDESYIGYYMGWDGKITEACTGAEAIRIVYQSREKVHNFLQAVPIDWELPLEIGYTQLEFNYG